jgi:pimeloyl-ACP methyl ester carboxylesterase
VGSQLQAIARALRPLEGPGARDAFVQSLRAVIDAHGQRVSATDRLYLLDAVPTLIAWGERDRTIPLAHGRAAHAAVPHSRFVTFADAAHFPHLEAPAELAAALDEFVATTEPARLDEAAWRATLRRRSEVRPRAA